MKKSWILGFLLMFLTACQLDPNTEELYEKPASIHLNTNIPSHISSPKEQAFRFLIKENGQPIRASSDIKISVRKYGEDLQTTVKAELKGEGVYRSSYKFPEDGLYDIRLDVTTADQHIMPTKRIAVGQLTEEEKDVLHNKQKKEKQTHSHH
ncbi:FixH family protein [Bacillus pumilus]|uniref:FixH family protein n=1 Tax=Bacillus pumilus TaxID=1408 RepID=UPI002492780B|nr:FixH family protein [Bacillus pumilus]